jgi:hypothetical protein
MRPDAEEALCNYEAYQAEIRKRDRRMGMAIVATAIFLGVLGWVLTR